MIRPFWGRKEKNKRTNSPSVSAISPQKKHAFIHGPQTKRKMANGNQKVNRIHLESDWNPCLASLDKKQVNFIILILHVVKKWPSLVACNQSKPSFLSFICNKTSSFSALSVEFREYLFYLQLKQFWFLHRLVSTGWFLSVVG